MSDRAASIHRLPVALIAPLRGRGEIETLWAFLLRTEPWVLAMTDNLEEAFAPELCEADRIATRTGYAPIIADEDGPTY